MFKAQLIFILHILSYFQFKAELCRDNGVEFERAYVTDGQPVFVSCPLDFLLEENNFSVTWYKNGSQTEITRDRQTRVHQDQSYLKFIPAKLDDDGFYSCVLRNETYCTQMLKRVEVFKNDNGLCYNHTVMFPNEVMRKSINQIQCPNMMKYVDYKKTQIKWFKECQPLNLDSNKYSNKGNLLYISNSTIQDSGNYTCEATIIYNGTDYKISRSIDYTIKEEKEKITPYLLYPRNNFLQVELGAAINITCEVSFSGMIDLFWTVNDSFIDEYSEDGRVVMGQMYSFTKDKETHTAINLNFSKVQEEDYNREFYCHIYPSATRKAFIVLKHPDPNIQGFLIAFFVTLMFLVIIAVIAIRIFKVDIVLWYRSSCFARKDYKDGKVYDAYIMYPKKFMGSSSYDMEIFVLKVLPEVLENHCAYRLFIIGRDDLPGQAIADLVDEAISQSRRLIIILGDITNENSLSDDFEQKIAMYDALIRNKIKVILIELEKITDYTYMPESIKYIKQKQGVVRWKGEFREANLQPNTRFWKNVRYRMPPAQHPSDKELYHLRSSV